MLRVIDADVLIAAKDHYYPFDVCPGFWECMSHAFHAGEIISAERVYGEITNVEGPLKEWVKPFKKYFLSADKEVKVARAEVVAYIKSAYKSKGKRAKFIAGADTWLIAAAIVKQRAVIAKAGATTAKQKAAIAKQIIVVTNEVRIKGDPSDSRVKIPNVCEAFGVECEKNIYRFMKEEEVRLVLDRG